MAGGRRGGQHVNKTESASGLTHIPSGIVVFHAGQIDPRSTGKCAEGRWRLLRSRLYDFEPPEIRRGTRSDRRGQVGRETGPSASAPTNFPKEEGAIIDQT